MPRLATLGVQPQDVFVALQRQNAPDARRLDRDRRARRFRSASTARTTTLRRSRDTPIVVGGRTLKLSDIADVRRGYEDPATFLIRHEGEPAMSSAW